MPLLSPPPVRHALAVIAAALLVLGNAGCTKRYERQVYETACGQGKLRMTIHVTTHAPAANEAKLWIEYEVGGQRRTVDVVKPRTTLYAPPTSTERYARLRTGDDDWPIFISPGEFSLAEYDLIRARLQAVLPEIDAAMLTAESPGERLDFGNVARFSSTRYTDYEGLRRVYASARKDVRVELFPDGEIWCFHPMGMTLVGSVVDSGHKALLPVGHGLLEKAGIPDPVNFVLACRDAKDRTIASEFAVERPTNKEYEVALQRERTERRKR